MRAPLFEVWTGERESTYRSRGADISKWASFVNSRALQKEPEVLQRPAHEAALLPEQTWVQGSSPSPVSTGPGLTQFLLSLRTSVQSVSWILMKSE